MVRGSGSESGDKESNNKSSYCGSLIRWPQGSLKLKAVLFLKGLWEVVEKGPTTVQVSPVLVTPGDFERDTIPQEWYYAGRDNKVQGPYSAEELARVLEQISQIERLTEESVIVYHVDNTAGEWEPWSAKVSNLINIQRSLENNIRKLRTPDFPFAGNDSAVRMLAFGGSGYPASASQRPSARDREYGQQRPCTEENDRASFHAIVQGIDDSADSIGESLVLSIGDKFKDNESGHLLWAWLEKRAGCGSVQGGLVDADDIKRQIEEYKFCEGGKVITVEELALGSEKFERMYMRQPKERQGIRGDMFDKWVSKLPKSPFHSELLPIISAMNVVKNGSVYADYSESNESLRAIYANYLKSHPPVKGIGAAKESDTALVGKGAPYWAKGDKGKGKGLGKGGGKGFSIFCFRCWAKDSHLSGQCDSPPGTCTACGMDSNTARLSCGGEQDPKKCIIKGYRPVGGSLPRTYLERLKEYANNNNINFVDSGVATPARALSSLTGPPPSTVGPGDSASVAGGYQGGAQTALAASAGFDPNNVQWRIQDGMWKHGLMMAPVALLAFGGRAQLAGEIDCVVDGGCTSEGCVSSAVLLTNLRDPEIQGMYVGNNKWCAAIATGDLEGFCIDTEGSVVNFTRKRHVVPDIAWHLHGETPEFKQHGGTVRKGTDMVLALPDGTEIVLLLGSDDMMRIPIFTQREHAETAAPSVARMHAAARREACATYDRAARGSAGTALVGVAINQAQADKFLQWHATMGCQASESMLFTLKNATGHGSIQVPYNAAEQFGQCDFCNLHKLIAEPHPASLAHAARFGERVLFDDLGPFPVPCLITGARWVRKFTDEATNLYAAYPIVAYDSAEAVAVIKIFMGDHAYLLPPGATYSIMRTDGASILRATVVRDLFDGELITAEASMPRVPQQMGQNESAGRWVVRSANAMRGRARAGGMPCGPEYAVLAIQHACEVHNRAFSKTWRGMTCPIQLATGDQPDLSNLHIFGAAAWSRLTMQERADKLSVLGIKGQYVGLARGYSGSKLLIKDPATLQQAKLGNKPAVHIHNFTKLGIDMKVDDAALYRIGRKLLPKLQLTPVEQTSAPASYPRKAPEPSPELEPAHVIAPNPEQAPPSETPSDEGGAESTVVDNHPQKAPAKPRKEYPKQRPDGSQWKTRQSSRVESALISHATEGDITGYKPSTDGMGAYFSTEETVETIQLSDIPESDWYGEDIFTLIHHDEHGRLRVVGPEVKRHPYLVRVDKPGVDIETVALMAKVGDNADGVHVFDGRSDLTNQVDAEEWIKSRGSEIQQLKSIPTWKHVKLKVLKQLGIKPIRTMFVDKIKRTDQNKIEEFKSRGVACQFNAVAGKDYVDKFWHVARDSSISTVLAKGTERGVELFQIDLPGFYLQADPEDGTFDHEKPPILYISMLPGFAEKDDDGDEAAGVLTAAMYGTAIAGRAAGRKLSKDMQDNFGLTRGPYDRAVYRKEEDGNYLEVACIVDDMVVADYGGVLIKKFHEWLQERWGSGRTLVNDVAAKPIKFHPLTFCLGRKVNIDSDLGIVMVSGEQYIEDMHKRYMSTEGEAIVRTFKADVPSEEGIMKLSTASERQSSEAASLTRSLVQSLAYGATKFKNEILFHVGRLQRFADNPCDEVYKFALQVLKYCYKDKQFGIAWSRSSDDEGTMEFKESNDEVYASVDSSWQVHDKVTRSRSTTGMIFFWKNGPISVRSNGQKFQAITSTDAESHGIASAMYEGIVIRGHCKWSGIKFTKPTRLENDNSGGVLIARDAASMHHSRATAMRAVFCQECVELGMFDPTHVSAAFMTADLLTKWLSLNDFAKHRGKLTNRRAQYKIMEQKKN